MWQDAWRELSAGPGARELTIGHSVEGRPIRAYEVGAAGAPTVMLSALMHGSEVIGSIALAAVARELVGDGGAALRESLRFVFVPVVNPDAHAYNAERVAAGRPAYRRCNARGVDLNRNFSVLSQRTPWHPFAGSRFRAAPHYAGEHAFSEPETRALRDLVVETKPSLSVAFHSFGNLLLYPWGFKRDANPRAREYGALGSEFVRAQPVHRYDLRQAIGLYPTAGDLDDWLDAHFGCLAFTVEVSQLDGRLLSRRALNPFWWMNPVRADETVANLLPGVMALLSAYAEGAEVGVEDSRSVRRHPRLDIAAR